MVDFTGVSASMRRTLPPAVAVSSVAFALRPPADARLGEQKIDTAAITLWMPLVRRTRAPFDGAWALPGGPIPWNETLDDTAIRTLHEAVHRLPGYLEQLYSFGAVERSATAQRLVTIAYWALYGEAELSRPATRPHGPAHTSGTSAHGAARRRWDAPESDPRPSTAPVRNVEERPEPDPNVAWFSADRLPALAFDHAEIVHTALQRLRSKTEYAAVAHRFLGECFTLSQLRDVHEAILGSRVDPANFRRQMLAHGHLEATGEYTAGTAHRPARLYRFAGGTRPTRAAPAASLTSTSRPPQQRNSA